MWLPAAVASTCKQQVLDKREKNGELKTDGESQQQFMFPLICNMQEVVFNPIMY